MRRAQLLGLGILVVTVAASIALDHFGRSQQPVSLRVLFDRGATLSDGSAGTVDRAAGLMARNPALQAVLEGHTGTLGDAEANRRLSLQRAESVQQALIDAGVAADRVRLLATGAAAPLPRAEDESEAAYQRRLGRVEIILVSQ